MHREIELALLVNNFHKFPLKSKSKMSDKVRNSEHQGLLII